MEPKLFLYALQDSDLNKFNQWVPNVFDKFRTLHKITEVATD